MNKKNDIKFSEPVSKSESGVLAGLWRKICKETNIMPSLSFLVDKYVRKTNSMSDRVGTVRRKTKASLIANITASEMTFKTFLDLLFNFLNVIKVDIYIKLTFKNGAETAHSMSVTNDDMEREAARAAEKKKKNDDSSKSNDKGK